MSKEEMIKAISKGVFPSGHENHSSYAKGYNSAIEETVELLESHLDTYASEIAVGFAEYINEGIWAKYGSGLWYPFEPKDDDIGLTTPQIFQQFLTNKE